MEQLKTLFGRKSISKLWFIKITKHKIENPSQTIKKRFGVKIQKTIKENYQEISEILFSNKYWKYTRNLERMQCRK